MTKVGLLQFLILFLFVSEAVGQKIKYKDIFGLLNTKQYEQAEPFLKKYIRENDDNPNAFLFMGIIFQEKSAKSDVLKQTSMALANMDSAIIFYDKALKTITEKEVKRNDEFYQAYNRRDLRTGEFGVKLSDIQFDLQKRTEGLKERIDRVKMVKYYFALSDTLYKRSNALYKTIAGAYPTENAMYLRADEQTVKNLTALAVRFDSCTKAFDNYKASSGNLGKTGYNQVLTLKEVKDFKKDGSSLASFYDDDLGVWDYRKFADQTREVIEKEIIPMRDHLVNYDVEINKLREKLSHDSVSVRSDLTKLIDKLLFEHLKKFDPEPLPMEVFTLKISDLEYRSALLENRAFRDSSDVHLRLSKLKAEMRSLSKLDSIATKLAAENLEEEIVNYNHFISNTYSNSIVLKSYVKALKEYAEREKRNKDEELEMRTNALYWIVDQQDSIPLSFDKHSNKYKPLLLSDEKYTAGISYTDSLTSQGYFYTIKPSRKPEVKVLFPIDKQSFKLARLGSSKSITYSDPAGQIFFVVMYSERATKEKYPVTVAKIYRSDGLAWSSNYTLPFIPKDMAFKSDTGEFALIGETQRASIDKNGKLKP